MFVTITVASLAGTALLAGLHFLAGGRRRPPADEMGISLCHYNSWERLLWLGLWASFLVLFFTGFQAAFLTGERITGFALLFHVATGAVFLVCLALAALTWGESCRFTPADLDWSRQGGWLRPGPDVPADRFDPLEKAFFWILLLFGLATGLTMLLSMIPLFGPDELETLYHVHRYCALILVVAFLAHGYRMTLVKRGVLRRLTSGRVDRAWAEHYHPLWARTQPRKNEIEE